MLDQKNKLILDSVNREKLVYSTKIARITRHAIYAKKRYMLQTFG